MGSDATLSFISTLLGALIAGLVGVSIATYNAYEERKRIQEERAFKKSNSQANHVGSYCSKRISLIRTLAQNVMNARAFLLDHAKDLWEMNGEKPAAYTYASKIGGEALLDLIRQLDDLFDSAVVAGNDPKSQEEFLQLTKEGESIVGRIYTELEINTQIILR